MKVFRLGLILLLILLFCWVLPVHGGFFDSVTETLSEATDAVTDAGNKVVESVEEIGEEVGVLEKKVEPAAGDESAKTDENRNTDLSCEQYAEKLKAYTQGEKGLLPYASAEEMKVQKWSVLYAEAKPLSKEYTRQFAGGSCSSGDMHNKFLKVKIADFEAMYPDAAKNAGKNTSPASSSSNKGKFVFSKKPISPGESALLSDSFNAGDYIYGLVEVKKPWTQLYGKNNNFYVRVDVKVDGKKTVDGKKIHAQFITIKDPEYAKRDYLIFNVAPAVEKLVVYSDPNLMYGQTTAVIKQGPNELSYHLGRLAPGKHTVSFEMQNYGKMFAKGEFTIMGDSYSFYADLHEKIAKGVVAARTLPQAKSNNASLEQEMKELLMKAGWKNVYRLNIVDNDWWIMRASGGDSAVVGRYMDAAALTEDPKGKYYYKRCSFQQDKLLSGAFGPLFISKQGEPVPINKENIDK